MKKKPIIALLDYLFVLRPTLFFPVWTVFLIGHWAAFRFDPSASSPDQSFILFLDWTDLSVCLLLTCLMGAVFLINQIADVESDRLNKKLFLIANGEISSGAAYIETALLLFIAIVGAFLIRLELALVFLLTLFITGVLYSVAPFHFKNRIWGSILINMMGAPLVFGIGWLANGQIGLNLLFHTLPYATAIGAIFLLTTLPDVEGDRWAGKITFGVRYGISPTVTLALILEALTIILAIAARDWAILIPAMLALSFFVNAARRSNLPAVLLAVRLSVLFISLMVCIRYPLYLFVLILNFYLSKWYYRKRFNLDYPSFKTRG